MTAADLLDTPLVELRFTARVWNLIERRGLKTLRDLVEIDSASLRDEPNLGRRSIADLRAQLEAYLGTSWEIAALSATLGPISSPPPTAARSWRQLATLVPDALRSMPLAGVPGLPKRVLGFAARRGATTVGDLVDVPEASVRSAPNLGRKGIADAVAVFNELIARCPEVPRPPTPDDAPHLLAFWNARTAELEPSDRLVLQYRAGIGAEALTLEQTGALLGFTRERARQREARALDALLRSPQWIDAVEARLKALLPDGASALEEVCTKDPWFVSLRDERAFGRFFLEHLLGGRVGYVTLDGDLLATFTQEALTNAWNQLDAALRGGSWPKTRDAVEEQTARAAAPFGDAVLRAFKHRVASRVIADDDGARLLGYGRTRASEAAAFLRVAAGPVPVSEVVRRFGRRFGHGRLPNGLVLMGRGRVTALDCLEGFEACARRVIPRCERWMRANGPTRQWSCEELVRVVSDAPGLPAWFGPWPLAAMCQRSERVRYLGRLAVVLPEVEGERVRVRDVLVEVLDAAGAPLEITELRARALRRRDFSELTLCTMLPHRPFVETAPEVWGLRRRDLPGGETAAEQALEWTAEMLEARGRGIAFGDCLTKLRARSRVFDRWVEPMLHGVLRDDPRMLTSIQRAVGLSEWGDVRLPTRREILRQCFDEGGGRMSIATLRDRIAAVYGEAPTLRSLTGNAWRLGARVIDDELVLRGSDEAAPRSSLAGVPPQAIPLFESLRAHPLDDVETLRREVDAHVRRFFHEAVTSEEIDLTAVLAAQRVSHALLALAPGLDDAAKRIVGGAVRYFLHDDDGARDFTEGGLADDLAVLEAARQAVNVGAHNR